MPAALNFSLMNHVVSSALTGSSGNHDNNRLVNQYNSYLYIAAFYLSNWGTNHGN